MRKVVIKHLSKAKNRDIIHENNDDKRVSFARKVLGVHSENNFKLQEGEGYRVVVETFLEGTTWDILKEARSIDTRVPNDDARKTGWGDIIEIDGEPFMVGEYGFRNIHEKDLQNL